MLKKFLKEVIIIVVGKQVEDIVDLLDGVKYVNEFIIAKKLDLTINQTRNILYKIANYGLVSSIRKKDKRKGWYTYFWKIEVLKSLEFLKGILMKKKEQFAYQIKSRQTKQFYVCQRCNVEFNEENALLKDFTCNECGDIFTSKDNTKLLKEFQKHLERLDKELKLIEEEILNERQQLEKIKIKEEKKVKKEASEKRAKKRLLNKKLAEKEGEKLSKKKPPKKIKKKLIKKKPMKKKKVVKKKPVKKRK